MYMTRVGEKLWNDEAKVSANRKYNRHSVATGIIINDFGALKPLRFIFDLSLSRSKQHYIMLL